MAVCYCHDYTHAPREDSNGGYESLALMRVAQ